MHRNNENLADDLLEGAEAIADFTGLTTRQVYYLTNKNALPVFRLGGGLFGRKSEFRDGLSARKTFGNDEPKAA